MHSSSYRKQAGYSGLLIILLLALVISSVILGIQLAAKEAKQRDALVELTVDKIEEIYLSAAQYHTDNMAGVSDPLLQARWPANIAALYAVNYLRTCNSGVRCIPVDRTSWNSAITITPFTPVDTSDPANPKNLPAKLRLTLNTSGSSVDNAGDRGLAGRLMAYFPVAEVTGTTVNIEFSRPGVEIAHDALTRRDGTAEPTADWGFAGFKIEDIGDINYKDYIGGDGAPVSAKRSTFDTVGLFSHGQTVPMPRSCPSGTSPKIYTSLSHLVGRGGKAVKIGALQTFAQVSGSNWVIIIRYYTTPDSGTPTWEYPNWNDAKALIFTRCAA